MPWRSRSIMSWRLEFVTLAMQGGANIRQLCRRFGISPPVAYKWLERYRAHGAAGLHDRSRRPQASPAQTPAAVQQRVLALRQAHPCWGGRKLRARLLALGDCHVPAASTITTLLQRHAQIAQPTRPRGPWHRFQAAAPNQLWQMDFKGHFALHHGRCHPLTVLDDHSRFAVGLYACANERTQTVQRHLTEVFRRYGLPQRLLCDNGPPWGSAGAVSPWTPLTVWLLRLGIGVAHGRAYHPQTQGKDERFHRTLQAEVLQGPVPADGPACQARFDAWRQVYNQQRPHEALALAVPASRYQVSARPFPEALPEVIYGPTDQVRKVQSDGSISFRGRPVAVGSAFRGQRVAVRPTASDGCWQVYFSVQAVAQVDFRLPHEEP